MCIKNLDFHRVSLISLEKLDPKSGYWLFEKDMVRFGTIGTPAFECNNFRQKIFIKKLWKIILKILISKKKSKNIFWSKLFCRKSLIFRWKFWKFWKKFFLKNIFGKIIGFFILGWFFPLIKLILMFLVAFKESVNTPSGKIDPFKRRTLTSGPSARPGFCAAASGWRRTERCVRSVSGNNPPALVGFQSTSRKELGSVGYLRWYYHNVNVIEATER